MGSVDRLTLVELIEAEKAKLSSEARELWGELDTSLYVSLDEETRYKSHELDAIKRMALLPESERHVLNVLTELRASLYQSDYSKRLGELSQPHRDRCVIIVSFIKDRDERGPGNPMPLEDSLYRTVDEALYRLRED